jgi:hypothetical protein
LHSLDQEFAPVGARTRIQYGKRFAMFKRFLMENAHRENIKHLFRWWNGHVFSVGTPGVNRKDDDGFDSGMDEAEAALDSNEEFDDEGREEFDEEGHEKFDDKGREESGDEGREESGDDHESWYALEERPDPDQPALQMTANSRSDEISIDFIQLTISEHREAPSNPVAAPVHTIVVTRVHESTLVHSAGAASITYNFQLILLMAS